MHFIEDNQSLGSSLNGVQAGSIGDVSTLSFNANKVVVGIAGGGAILTDDKDKAELFKKLRRHGNNEVLGYNSKMLLLNVGFIDYRLQRMKQWQSKRQAIAKRYDEQLKEYVTIQQTNVFYNYHKYVIRLQNKEVRDRLKEKLGAKVHYDNFIRKQDVRENKT